MPFTQFATDLANHALPQYSFIAPNVDDDAHNGSLVLTSERDLRGFHDGDFVSVRGSLAGRANGRSLYRVTNIDRLPR